MQPYRILLCALFASLTTFTAGSPVQWTAAAASNDSDLSVLQYWTSGDLKTSDYSRWAMEEEETYIYTPAQQTVTMVNTNGLDADHTYEAQIAAWVLNENQITWKLRRSAAKLGLFRDYLNGHETVYQKTGNIRFVDREINQLKGRCVKAFLDGRTRSDSCTRPVRDYCRLIDPIAIQTAKKLDTVLRELKDPDPTNRNKWVGFMNWLEGHWPQQMLQEQGQ